MTGLLCPVAFWTLSYGLTKFKCERGWSAALLSLRISRKSMKISASIWTFGGCLFLFITGCSAVNSQSQDKPITEKHDTAQALSALRAKENHDLEPLARRCQQRKHDSATRDYPIEPADVL